MILSLLISSAFYRRFRNSEVDYRTGVVYISASNSKWKHKYSGWNSTGHATTKKWKCSFTQVRIALWIFLSPCKDVPWPEQKCLMIYLGLHKENRYILSYCAATFSSLFSKYCWHSLTLPLLLPTSTYFFTSVITWLVVNGEENELPQGIYQASLGHTVTNSKISMA